MSCFSKRCKDNIDIFSEVTELSYKVLEYAFKKINQNLPLKEKKRI